MAGDEGGGGSGIISVGGNERSSTNPSPPQYPVERGEAFVQRYYEELRRRGIGRNTVPQVDILPFFLSGEVTEVVDQIVADLAAGFQSSNSATTPQPKTLGEVAGLLTAGFLSSNTSHVAPPQGGDHVSIDMPAHQHVPAGQPPAPAELIKAIWSICFLTEIPAISTALYKPAGGVVFSHNKLSYYLVLSVIFASGLGEAFMAFWLSRPGGGSRRRLKFGRAVLCASVLPFVIVVGIAGYGFIQG